MDEGAVATASLTDSRALDLYDFGTHVRQDHRAERSGHDVRDIHDPDALEG
jgi:hypothetical protein